MHIRLSGLGFDALLISELEKNLLLAGFRLEDIAFEKEKNSFTDAIVSGTNAFNPEYNYTVSIVGKKFSITFANDEQFMRFFYNLCCTSEESGNHKGEVSLLEKVIKRTEKCVEITKHWLTNDPFLSTSANK